MGLDKTKRAIDPEKTAYRDKQSKVENKSTTFVQRGRRTLGVATMALLASARAIEATKVTNGETNQVKELADRMRHSTYNSRVEGYVPSPQQIE